MAEHKTVAEGSTAVGAPKPTIEDGTGELVRHEPTWPGGPGHHAVTELTSQYAGGLSPFGDDIRFPLPAEAINYEHPTALPNRSL